MLRQQAKSCCNLKGWKSGVSSLEEIKFLKEAPMGCIAIMLLFWLRMQSNEEPVSADFTSHLEYYYRRPRIPKSLLAQYRRIDNRSGCEAGEVYCRNAESTGRRNQQYC